MKALLSAAVMGVSMALAAPAVADGHGTRTYDEPDSEFAEPVEGAQRLEGRLLAPCCWDSSRQTLDIHGSPIANQLRREIRSRLRAGESTDAIEADLVRRYSKKILAVPPGNPLKEVGIALTVLVVLGGAGAASMLVRWRRRSSEGEGNGKGKKGKDTPPSAADPSARDEWDDRLDAELRDVD